GGGGDSAGSESLKRPLTRIPSLRFAALGIRPLPARGERLSKLPLRATQNEVETQIPDAPLSRGTGIIRQIARLMEGGASRPGPGWARIPSPCRACLPIPWRLPAARA